MLYLVESSFSPGELFWTGMEPVKAKYVVYIHRLTAGNFAESEKLVDDARVSALRPPPFVHDLRWFPLDIKLPRRFVDQFASPD